MLEVGWLTSQPYISFTYIVRNSSRIQNLDTGIPAPRNILKNYISTNNQTDIYELPF